MKRRHNTWSWLAVALILAVGGCSWWDGLTMRSQSPEEELLGTPAPRNRFVGDLVAPTAAARLPIEVSSVALVTGLHHTGSDPAPSSRRTVLVEEMRKHKIRNPDRILSTGDVSLVEVRAFLPPGAQKGDHVDVEVRTPANSETTSLRGGYLLQARLTESMFLGNQVHLGHTLALAEGPVLVDPSADPEKDRVASCRGCVLGGAVVRKSRELGLVLLPEHRGIINSQRVAKAINRRFHTFDHGEQIGVAKAKTDEWIELMLHPRYKDNVNRYLDVLGAIVLEETAQEKLERVAVLQEDLLDPTKAADAALQLEAIGRDGCDALCRGLKSPNTEVRFYAAEALAYLDRTEAAEPLGQIARAEPAFRVFALAALSTMREYAAYEQLRDMLPLASTETRYGAFRALWTMNRNDALVKGEVLGDAYHYHVLDTAGEPLVHVTASRLPEIVLFGANQRLLTPVSINAGNDIMINSTSDHEITIAKFSTTESDQKRTVSTRLDDVIHAIAELGGTYPDVVQAIQEAKRTGALTSRFAVDALPRAGRQYDRLAADEDAASVAQPEDQARADGAAKPTAKGPVSPMPSLFSTAADAAEPASMTDQETAADDQAQDAASTEDKSPQSAAADKEDEKEPSVAKKGIFTRMFGR